MWRSQGKKGNKYRAKKTTIDGIKFDSLKEAKRYSTLKLMEEQELIFNLALQVAFPISINGKHICKYMADFTYYNDKKEHIVEDVKGYKTQIYKLKKKMVEAYYNIKINEV